MKELLFVFIGGGAGSVLRYMDTLVWQHLSLMPRFQNMTLPWPTLAVNVIGCFFISLIYINSEHWGLSPEQRLLLTTGLCGGLTTFSTFSYEGLTLLRTGHTTAYIAYLVLSIVLGLAAASLPFVIRTHTA